MLAGVIEIMLSAPKLSDSTAKFLLLNFNCTMHLSCILQQVALESVL